MLSAHSRPWRVLNHAAVRPVIADIRRECKTLHGRTHTMRTKRELAAFEQKAAFVRFTDLHLGLHTRCTPPLTTTLLQVDSLPIPPSVMIWMEDSDASHRPILSSGSADGPLNDVLTTRIPSYVKYLGQSDHLYRDGLILLLTDGRIEMDNNVAERSIRPIALQRKNALFEGHDTGAQNWALLASRIEACKIEQD